MKLFLCVKLLLGDKKMKYKLMNEINPDYSAIEQILTNRGISYE